MSPNPTPVRGLFAYPSQQPIVSRSILAAIQKVNSAGRIALQQWEKVDNWGKPLIEPILSTIASYELLVADITKLNFNVTFEVGFAIGSKKRVLPVLNTSVETDERLFKEIGIYDTLGYKKYQNAEDLEALLSASLDLKPIYFSSLKDTTSPIFFLEKPARGDDVGRIISRIKKSYIRYRSFLPKEEDRLPAPYAIEQIAKSVSVIIPLCTGKERDAVKHNIRAAFLAGLAVGMNCSALILNPYNNAAPLDVRDAATTWRELDDLDEHVNQLIFKTYDYLNNRPVELESHRNALSALTIGDPIAENELGILGNYYVRTDEFGRARRGEINLVLGRKGTGKTALWAQLRDDIRRNPANIVTDLKPEGYQLIKLKEDVLDFLTVGAKSHLIIAFWEYILLMELAYKLLEKDSDRYMRDNRLYDKYLRLEGFLRADKAFVGPGDFSERLKSIADRVIDRYKTAHISAPDQRLSNQEVTELLYSQHLRQLREAIESYLLEKEEVWILFDNLDKGWASYGLATEDVFILRCLLDAARKIGNDVRRAIEKFRVIVFVRNDIYQLLMDQSPDFGKEVRCSLDWSDREQLKNILLRRLKLGRDPHTSAEYVWSEICTPHYKGQKTLDLFIDWSLMRPRNLLKIFNYCRGAAVNRERQIIDESEIERGLHAYSDDLLVDFSNELRDVCPPATDVLYKFIGEKSGYGHGELVRVVRSTGVDASTAERVIEYMLYYGLFGVRMSDGTSSNIFDTGYDLKKLRALAEKSPRSNYDLHPALRPALGIRW